MNDADEFDVTAISDTNAATDEVAEDALAGATVGVTAFASDGDGSDAVQYSLSRKTRAARLRSMRRRAW